MKSVTLYTFSSPDIRISMEMYFDRKGQLIFDGYDIGKNVKDYWGDSDYEYTYTIKPKEVGKIYDILGVPKGEKEKLLLVLQQQFSGERAYHDFGEFMEKHGIEYRGFTYA